jgi:hypothetical protein
VLLLLGKLKLDISHNVSQILRIVWLDSGYEKFDGLAKFLSASIFGTAKSP